MALDKTLNPKVREAAEQGGEKKSDLEQLMAHVNENPLLYVVSTAFVFVCLLAGGVYGLFQSSRDQDIRTEYAAALQEVDPALVAANLEALAEKSGAWAPEIWYMLGEYSIRAQTYGKAEDAFTVVIEEYPGSEFAPRAMDGLGYIHENRGDFQKALEAYNQLVENEAWADTLVAKRQQLNIGRVLEKMEHFADAKMAFENQMDEFPGTLLEPSMFSNLASASLDRLRAEHPELFPEDEEDAVEADTAEEPPAEEDAGEAQPE